MFKSLKLKLLFFFFLANIIILFAFSVFIYFTAQKGVSDTLDNTMKIISIDVIPDLKGKTYVDAKEISNELIGEFGISPLDIKIIYFNKIKNVIEYETLSSAEKSKLFNIPLSTLGNLHIPYYYDKERFRVSSILLFEDEEMKIFFQLAIKKVVHSQYLNQITLGLLIANPIILVLLLLLANILINRTLFHMKEVITSVQSISFNKLSNRIESKNIPSEIEELVETFNQLLQSLEESFNKISTFTSDASHELKTPLTVIRGDIEVALRHDRSLQEYKDVLKEILQETILVQETIEQLFFITKKDSQEFVNNKENIYLDEIVMEVIKQMDKIAAKKAVHLKPINILPLTIYANETLMKIAMSNIIKNAIVYSQEISEIHISMHEFDGFYTLNIIDHGCGISQENIPFIFERFYRVDKTRSRKDGGTGLGLAIVKMILDIHHYDIEVKSVLGTGTEVILKFRK